MIRLARHFVNTAVVGFVTDPRPYLWQAGLFVLPMQSGAGIKNKLLEAWAAECAVVSTPLGTEGVEYVKDKGNVLIAASPQEMIAAVVSLMTDVDQQKRLGETGRQTAVQHYSWQSAAAQLERYLTEIAEETHSKRS
jgi:glycosyltransferase involved in cell wall biosynthesis